MRWEHSIISYIKKAKLDANFMVSTQTKKMASSFAATMASTTMSSMCLQQNGYILLCILYSFM